MKIKCGGIDCTVCSVIRFTERDVYHTLGHYFCKFFGSCVIFIKSNVGLLRIISV